MRAMTWWGLYEVRHVQSGKFAAAHVGVPAPAGRLHAISRGCFQPEFAVAFPSDGRRLVFLGGFGAEDESRPGLFRNRGANNMKNGKYSPQSILIVEDHPLLKWLTVDLVTDAGFVVLQASNADEAVAILKSRSDIALVLTSIKMSGSMDGLELAHIVRNRWPSIKIIVASGRVRSPEFDLPTGSGLFTKPYDSKAMISEIRSLIGP